MFHDTTLTAYFEGWDEYQARLIAAVGGLSAEQLAWRPAPSLRSTGELVRHIAIGRLNRLLLLQAPGTRQMASRVSTWEEDSSGYRFAVEESAAIHEQAGQLVEWLETTWQSIAQTLRNWTPNDLRRTIQYTKRGTGSLVTRQWMLWRILAHDLHHGGELSLMLKMQGLEPLPAGELADLASPNKQGWQSMMRRYTY